MNKIVAKEMLSENVVKLVVEAPQISQKQSPGQFVIIRTDDRGERIPLTIADADKEKMTITLIIQIVGTSSHKIANLNPGDSLLDISGPLGKPTHIENVGTVVACGGGVGIAPLYPIARAFKEIGNKLITVLGARNRELLILEKEMAVFADEMIVMTDDGSYGEKGLITAGIEKVLLREPVHLAVAIGPAVMMKFVALLTKKYDVATIASLNTIMVDGTGMCGACRVTVGGKTKFVCVDGPEFDAHEIDYDEMLKRLNTYKKEEQVSYDGYLKSLT
ncbi:MAG: sulfide/dihydroorotate dehydrogenase-like FAD/NAD-binding protein [Acidobacteria bacterium]|nr:sulfide/dihydroorotate dehydrogenase-like FAD/NAD-binding protein [Acidobacteriota bacterium]MBU4306299.1 sulfide/dihydroorotate dehydrogenase-like FAD/NAD-binding protein [Acidobacteriota bacterium]MCG2812366.1 sulfide/dihydroorotate dehydrogenase-like FAD/NAD-binding protein [Candidatus Aminicenantes bacterium]